MSFLVAGDTHGTLDIGKVVQYYNKHDGEFTKDDYLIILGDVGVCGFSPSVEAETREILRNLPVTTLFIDGNHENFEMLNSMPLVEFHGALMHQIDKHIFHILRGEILTLEGKTFLCIGGGNSIDKMYRIPYISWWPEEEITYHDVDNAIANLGKVNNKVDYVLTHCCDSATVVKAFGFRRDSSTDQLMFIDKVVNYKHWYFGHYHFDREINEKKSCLYNSIVELDAE